MRIDSNGNIEIESEEDYKNEIVNDYGFTSNPEQSIYTKDLRHCVGLGFVKEAGQIKKRGLIHILYNKEFERNQDGKIILSESRAKKADEVLKKFLIEFEKDEEGSRIFKNPKAIIVYTCSLPIGENIKKINLRSEFTGEVNPREVNDLNRYENPMADYVKGWLEKQKVVLYGSNATSNKKLPSVLNIGEDPEEICYKEFSLMHDRIKIGMYNKKGILLRKKIMKPV